MQNIRYVEMRHRGLLYVSGPDARDFLQSLISNDMRLVDHDTGIYSALLTPQGKYLHDIFICEGGPGVAFSDHASVEKDDTAQTAPCSGCGRHFLLEADRAADLARRLTMYKLRADVSIEVLDQWRVVALFGNELFQTLGMRQVAGDTREFGAPGAGGRRLTDPRQAAMGARCYLPDAAVEPALAEIGAIAGALVDFDQARICKGLPDGCRDIDVEKGTLLENRVDLVGGVSWTKGCYVGQEVTARMKYRNLGKKQLFVVDLEGKAQAKGTPVMFAGAQVGELRTCVPGIGLAMLRHDAVEKFQRMGGSFTANGTSLLPRIENEHPNASATMAS